MKTVLATMLVALAASSLASAADTPAPLVTQAVRAEVAAFNARDWRALWNLHSPRFRGACAYGRYAAAERRAADGATIDRVGGVRVRRVSASRGLASYALVFAHGGRRVVNADVPFVKVGARWLEDYAPRIGCG